MGRFLVVFLGLALVLAVSATPATAICLATGKPCGAPISINDTKCCPGMVCGPWGNVCQGGCRINGTAYRAFSPNPANQCQSCQPSVSTTSWTNVPNGSGCGDGNRCTQTDTCQGGVCVGSNPVVCTPQDQCHVAGICNPATGVCSNPSKTDGTPCDDGNLCTQASACQGGVCTGSNPVVCLPPWDACHVQGTCNPATGTCSDPIAHDGTPCNDWNVCTQTDTCQGGVCTGSNPVTCQADPCHDPCHVVGTCDPTTGCSHPNAPNGTPCHVGDQCMLDACFDGTCTPVCPNSLFDHCTNNIQDCDETTVDCGGSCPCANIFCASTACACGQDSNGDCLWSQTTEGSCYCGSDVACLAFGFCNTSADCPTGTQCVSTCCVSGRGTCLPPCGVLLENKPLPGGGGVRSSGSGK